MQPYPASWQLDGRYSPAASLSNLDTRDPGCCQLGMCPTWTPGILESRRPGMCPTWTQPDPGSCRPGMCPTWTPGIQESHRPEMCPTWTPAEPGSRRPEICPIWTHWAEGAAWVPLCDTLYFLFGFPMIKYLWCYQIR